MLECACLGACENWVKYSEIAVSCTNMHADLGGEGSVHFIIVSLCASSHDTNTSLLRLPLSQLPQSEFFMLKNK